MRRDFFDVDTACGGSNISEATRIPIQHQAQVYLARDFRTHLHVHLMYGQAFGSGLMRDQDGSEHGFGGVPNCLEIFDHFDAARLTPAAGVNLRLDHPQRSSESLGSGHGRVRRVGNLAFGDGDGVLGEQFF